MADENIVHVDIVPFEQPYELVDTLYDEELKQKYMVVRRLESDGEYHRYKFYNITLNGREVQTSNKPDDHQTLDINVSFTADNSIINNNRYINEIAESLKKVFKDMDKEEESDNIPEDVKSMIVDPQTAAEKIKAQIEEFCKEKKYEFGHTDV